MATCMPAVLRRFSPTVLFSFMAVSTAQTLSGILTFTTLLYTIDIEFLLMEASYLECVDSACGCDQAIKLLHCNIPFMHKPQTAHVASFI